MASSRVKVYLELIKFEHTIFALPFAYLGMVLAANGLPTLRQFLLITAAMVGARTLAMALNRLIDHEIDRRNPRTRNRPLPAGQVTEAKVWILSAGALAMLLFSAWQLNQLCLELAPVAVVLLVGYSYTKRFTWLCHYSLGIAIGSAPVGAWAGVTGALSLPAALLFIAVATWIAGFDVIYACQDVDFDRQEGLHSLPADFGLRAALLISSATHVVTMAALLALGLISGLGPLYWVGLAAAAAIIAYEHGIVRPSDLSRVNVAFFNLNGYVSVVLFLFTFGAVVTRLMG